MISMKWMAGRLSVLALAGAACAGPAAEKNEPPPEEPAVDEADRAGELEAEDVRYEGPSARRHPAQLSREHYGYVDCRALAMAVGSIDGWYLDGSDHGTELLGVARVYAAETGADWRRAEVREVIAHWANAVYGSEVEAGPVGLMADRAGDIVREVREHAREECEGSGPVPPKGGGRSPAWSPDGSMIAFASHRDGGPNLYVMNADGSGIRRLTFRSYVVLNADGGVEELASVPPGDLGSPAWSPDGSMIAFAGAREEHCQGSDCQRLGHIRMLDVGRGTSVELHMAYADEAYAYDEFSEASPAWSPDGSMIAFEAEYSFTTLGDDPGPRILVAQADGSSARHLTEGARPAWSPDGSRIAFVGEAEDGVRGVFVIDADVNGIARLLVSGGNAPAWSPDGSTIAFAAELDGGPGIYTINADGSGTAGLVRSGAGAPAWSPDGSRIAFEAYVDGRTEVFAMNADGSGVTQLTGDGGPEVIGVLAPR